MGALWVVNSASKELPLHKLVLFFGRILQFLIVGSVMMVSI